MLLTELKTCSFILNVTEEFSLVNYRFSIILGGENGSVYLSF